MKKIISKVLIIFIITIILFEFSFSSNVSYAFDSDDINSITNLIGGLVSVVLWIPRLLVTAISWLMGTLLTVTVAESCDVNFGNKGECATPFDIFFNKYKFLDVNFFDISDGAADATMIDIVRIQVAQWFYILRTLSAIVLLAILIYVGIRMAISTIAEEKAKYQKMLWDWCCSMALIFVLQYIAIFVIETNNIIVNFLKNYLTGDPGFTNIGDAISEIMDQAMGAMGIGSLVSTFVYCMIIFQTIAFMLVYIKRMIKVGFLIVISPMISITYSIDKMGDGKAQALNKWLKEFVYTILIQPFHCIMYIAFVNTAVNLLNTGATVSDVRNEDLWEAIGHMNQLANGFLAILCLKFINDGEKALRKIFNFQDDGNMTSLAAGAAIGMAAISNAQKIGKATSKGITSARNLSTKLNNALAKDGKNGAFGKIGEHLKNAKDSFNSTGAGQLLGNLGNKLGSVGNKLGSVGNKLGELGEKIGNTKIGQMGKKVFEAGRFAGGKILNAGKFVSKNAKKIRNRVKEKGDIFAKNHKGLMKSIKGAKTLGSNALRKSMPIALGMMGMAMSYSTGSSGAMEALGVGSGLKRGSEEFLATSQGTIEGNVQESVNEYVDNNEEVQAAQKELDQNTDNIEEASENLEETNETIENMTSAEQSNGNDYLQILRDDDRQAELKAKGDEINQKELDELAKLEKREAERAKLKKNLSDDPEIAKVLPIFEQKHKLEKQLAEQRSQREILQEKLKNKRANIAGAIIENFRKNGGAAQIASAKNEITKAIQKCMMERKYKDSQGDVNVEYTLTDKETSSSERMQESICALLDRAVVAGGASLDAGQVFKRYFGEDSDSPMAESLKQAIDAYQYQARAKNYNENEDLYKNTGGTKEKFENDIVTRASKMG